MENEIEYAKELYARGLAPLQSKIDPTNLNEGGAILTYFILERKGIIVNNEPPSRAILRACIEDMSASEREKRKVLECLLAAQGRLQPNSFSIANRILNESDEFGNGSCVAREFERVGEIYDERAADYAYKDVIERIAEVQTPSWLSGDATTFDLSSYGSMTRDSKFGVDFSLCTEYLRKLKLIPVCDGSVKSLMLRKGGYPTSHPEFLEIFNRVQFVGLRVMRRLVADRQDVVWISSGSQFGCPLRHKESRIREVYSDGRLFGVVSASALNGGYGGLRLNKFDSSPDKDYGLGNLHAKFIDGVKVAS